MRICIYIFILTCSSWNFVICQEYARTLKAKQHAKYLDYKYTGNRTGDIVYWYITSSPSTTINITLTEASWTSTRDCQTDHLHLHDNGSSLVVKFCGSNSSTMQSHSKSVKVVFYSGSGFHATFKLRYREMRPCKMTTVPYYHEFVVEGDRFTLSCTSDCPSPVLYSWYHYNSKYGINDYLSVDKPHGNLTVNQATRNHDGIFICTASHYALTDDDTGYSASKSVYITMYYGPDSSMSLTSDKSGYNEGKRAILTCSADCKPDCTYSWRFKGHIIKSLIFMKSGKFGVRKLTRNSVYTCIAINTKLKKRCEKNITLAVYYGPDNSTSISRDGRKFAVAGENFSLVCVADCFPACLYSWSFENSHLIQPYSSSGILNIRNVNKNDAGMYTCFSRNSKTASIGKRVFHLEVFYQPIIENFQINNQSLSAYVNEHDKVDVICSIDSKPASIIELRNNTNQIKVVHNSTRIQFAWKEASCEDSNIYFCTADNSVNERVKKQIELFVHCHPRLNYHESFMSSFTAQLGNDAVLHISVIAFPPPVFTWYKLVNGQWKLLKQTEPVKTNSWSSVGQLILYKTKGEDAGDYQVVVSSEKFDTKLMKKLNLVLTDSTQDMKTIYIGTAAGGAVLLVVVLIILVFVLIIKRRDDLQRNSRTGNENVSDVPDYLEMETDEDLKRNENVSVVPDYMEIEIETKDHSRNTLGDNYLVPCTPNGDLRTGNAKSDKNTLEQDYLVPCPPEDDSESGTGITKYYNNTLDEDYLVPCPSKDDSESSVDNKDLRDSYSKLEAVRIEQNHYEKI